MKNKLKFLAFALIFSTNYGFCQTDSTLFFSKELSWNSFEETTNYVPQLILSQHLNRLIEINDPKKIGILIEKLKNPECTVAAHIALTKIFDSTYVGFGRLDGKVSSTIKYMYNGLEWERNYKKSKKGEGKIKKDEVKKITMFWERKYSDIK